MATLDEVIQKYKYLADADWQRAMYDLDDMLRKLPEQERSRLYKSEQWDVALAAMRTEMLDEINAARKASAAPPITSYNPLPHLFKHNSEAQNLFASLTWAFIIIIAVVGIMWFTGLFGIDDLFL